MFTKCVVGNVARGKDISAFDTYQRGIPQRAIDGLLSRNDDMHFGSCYVPSPIPMTGTKYLRIDFGGLYSIMSFSIWFSESRYPLYLVTLL